MLLTWITLLAVGMASLIDLKTQRIPNLITLPAIVLGLIINYYFTGLAGLGDAFSGLVIGVLLLFIPFVLGGIGAGDVKLLAAVGALNGSQFALYSFINTAIAGGIIALGLAVYKGQLYKVMFNILSLFPYFVRSSLPVNSGIRFPYGSAIFIGTLTAYILRWN